MKTIFLSFIACFALLSQGYAQKTRIDKITYELINLDGQTGAAVTEGSKAAGAVTIQDNVAIDNKEYPVICIGKSAFYGNDKITSIQFPRHLIKIEPFAFCDNKSLSGITFTGDRLTTIGDESFRGCNNLLKIDIPQSVHTIGNNAFYAYQAHTEMTIPSSVTTIGKNALRGTVHITLPEGIVEINESAFGGPSYGKKYTGLKTPGGFIDGTVFYHCQTVYLTLPGTVTRIQANAFSQIYATEFHITLPESVREIGESAFTKTSIKSINFPARLQTIGKYAFYQTTLEKVDIPGATDIQEAAFSECQKLKKATLSSACSIGAKGFSKCPAIGKVEFVENATPGTNTAIGEQAFYGCGNLQSIHIPSTVSRIGKMAFWDCNLRQVAGLNANITYDLTEYGQDPFQGNKQFHFPEIKKKFSYHALGKINKELSEWMRKKEFETTAQWQSRVTAESRDRRAKELIAQAEKEYLQKNSPLAPQYTIGAYDADYKTFPVTMKDFGTQYINVPAEEAQAFKKDFPQASFIPKFRVKNDLPELAALSVRLLNGKTYHSLAAAPEAETALALNLPPLQLNIGHDETPALAPLPRPVDNSVDINIPETGAAAPTTFALIIANENYTREARVPFAARDGEVFAQYCNKTLGIPEKNIRLVKDATLNDMKFQLNWLGEVLAAYNGSARAIVYYAGHGIPGESDRSAYLLPADGYGSDPGTGFALKDFYAGLGNVPAESVTVFLDACFSGTKRESGMMTAARGVAIKVRNEAPRGNMVVFSAAQGDETAYQYAEKGHGMFTYFLLKKLQESQGNITLGELSRYITAEVKKASIVTNNKSQTPTVIPSPGMNGWEERKLK